TWSEVHSAPEEMNLLSLICRTTPTRQALPPFIRRIEDIRSIRFVRLQGPVGMDIGAQAAAAEDMAAQSESVFQRSVIFDFQSTSDWDFATVSYMVEALRNRLAAHAQVGLINVPPKLIAELEIAKVQGLFRIFDSEKQAIKEMTKDM